MEDLFDFMSEDNCRFENIINELTIYAKELESSYGHKEDTLRVEKNVIKTEVNYPVSIFEPPYIFGDIDGKEGITTRLVTLVKTSDRSKNPHCAELRLSIPCFMKFVCPEGSIVKERYASEKDEKTGKIVKKLVGYSIFVNLYHLSLMQNLKTYINKMLSEYRSSVQPSFACCHKYQECSVAGKCTHDNKMFATVCSYRQRLLEGNNYLGGNHE